MKQPLVSQCYAMCNELLHVQYRCEPVIIKFIDHYCSSDSCDSGTVLHLHCKFMTKVTHSFMLILVNVHESLLSCARMCLVMPVCVCT